MKANMIRLKQYSILCGVFFISAFANAAIEASAPVVFVESLKKKELFETLTYPARIVPKVNTTILAETDGVVRRIHSPLGQSVGRKARLMTISQSDPVYQYAPVSVIAPVAGIVSSVEVTEGSQVSKGQRLATVTDPSQVSLTVEVPAQDLAFVSKGMTGEFRVSGREEKVGVRVRGVSPFVDPATGTASCELEIQAPSRNVAGKKASSGSSLPPGLLGQVTFKANARQGITIPDYAVVYRGKETLLRVVESGHAKQVPVKLGRKERGMVELMQGPGEGAQMVLRTSRYVADGEAVTVESEKLESAAKAEAPAQ